MIIDTYTLNLITHAAGRAIIELSLMDGLITKTSMLDKLHELCDESHTEEDKRLFEYAAVIVRLGSLSGIQFIDD